MATFTMAASNSMRPYRNTRIAYFLEAASQSFKAGQVVTLSGGSIIKGTTAPAANVVVGIAAEPASGIIGKKIGVYLATEDAEFKGNVQDTQALSLSQIGAQFGLILDATYDIFRVNVSDTTNKRVTITELIDQVGDINGLVAFKWMNAARVPHWS